MRRPPRDENGNRLDPPESVAVDLLGRQRSDGGRVEMIRQVRDYELITPLYGGGVEPATPDPVTTVRAPEVRGQLRFWWRACRAARYGTPDEMKAVEDAVWGSTESPSEVTVVLTPDGTSTPRREVAYWVEKNPKKNDRPEMASSDKIHPYAAFPLQPDESERKQVGWKSEEVLTGVRFTLEVSYPRSLTVRGGGGREETLDTGAEVNAALWAWETFGGIGARTRRGFGALRLSRVDGEAIAPPRADALEGVIKAGLTSHVLEGGGPAGVPRLTRGATFKLTAPSRDPVGAWKGLIEKLRTFRQYRKNKEGHPHPYGASQWPEAQAIRSLARGGDAEVNKFPRADFGLPIIFHLPHAGLSATLKGRSEDGGEVERLASPLVLRPVVCSDGAVGLALILESPRTPPGGLLLTGLSRTHRVSSELTEAEARRVSRRLEPLRDMTDVLEAFLQTL
jgi:CRISPR-associated protein Cmr1